MKHSKSMTNSKETAELTVDPPSLHAPSASPTAVTDSTGSNTSEVLGSLIAVYPPGGGPSVSNVPISEADLAAASDAAKSIETALPIGDFASVVSQALDTLQSAQSELLGALGSSVPPSSIPTSVPSIPLSAASVADTPATANTSSTASIPPVESPPSSNNGSASTTISSTPPNEANVVLEPPKTINVTIGDGATRFTPAYIKANPGDTILFNWVGQNNHSVTETELLGSCNKSTAPGAFDSGIQVPGTKWSLELPSNAKGLKFFYCKVAKHCEAGGMSGTIIVPE